MYSFNKINTILNKTNTMKKLLLLIPIILFSCTSRENYINIYAKETLDSALSNLDNTARMQSNWDSTLNQLLLIEDEEMDSSYIKLCNDFDKSRYEVFNIDKQEVLNQFERIKTVSCDSALYYSTDFDNKIETLQIENLKSFYLLYKEKQKIINNRNKKLIVDDIDM
jgi:hypothetical protein